MDNYFIIAGPLFNLLWYLIFMKNAYKKHYTEEGEFDKYVSVFPIKVNWLIISLAVSAFPAIGIFLFIMLSLIYYTDLKRDNRDNVIMRWDIPGEKVFWTKTIYRPDDIIIKNKEE